MSNTKTFTLTADEEQIKAIYLCMDAALRSAGGKALDAAVMVRDLLNTAIVVEIPAPEPPVE
jgi:hypothetical protein